MAFFSQKPDPQSRVPQDTVAYNTEPAYPWYWIGNIDQLDSPALVVYPDRVKENIRMAIGMVGSPARLRPHVKTHKSPEVARLLLEAGIHKFKCATIAEAEMLALAGAPDVLLAYQPIGPKLQRFVSLIGKYPGTKFSCLVDHPDAAHAMSAVFSARQLNVSVYLDLNIGMNRTGIVPGEAALALYADCAQLPGILPVGLHAYDGHCRDKDLQLRRKQCDAGFAKVTALQDQLQGMGFPRPIIVAGGSPTFSIHSKREQIECSPGTFIYWDKGYSDLCPEQPFLPAALVVTRVISLPDNDRICLDLGHKSIAAENELARRVWFLNFPDGKAIGQSEEHLVMEAAPGHTHRPGDLFYGLPFHICPSVALYERAYTIENGLVTGEWKNQARDRKITV
jgi:D-serine deaminase-like pyridoxal phosphate-dependent protein